MVTCNNLYTNVTHFVNEFFCLILALYIYISNQFLKNMKLKVEFFYKSQWIHVFQETKKIHHFTFVIYCIWEELSDQSQNIILRIDYQNNLLCNESNNEFQNFVGRKFFSSQNSVCHIVMLFSCKIVQMIVMNKNNSFKLYRK